MKWRVICSGLRDVDGKTPTHDFETRGEAEKFAEWGHFCFAWHRIERIAEPAR